MARNSSGTYTRVSNSFTAPVTGTIIDPAAADALWDELDTEITDSYSRSIKGGMLSDGTAAAPAFTWSSDLDTGIYRIGANNIGIAAGGTKIVDVLTTGLTVTGALIAASANHALGVSATVGYIGLRLTMNFTSNGGSTFVAGVDCDPTLVMASGDTDYGTYLNVAGFGITTQATDTVSVVSSVRIAEPQITVGAAGTVTTAASLYIDGAPTEGTVSAALLVNSGAVRFRSGYLNVTSGTTIAGGASTNGFYKDAEHAEEVCIFKHAAATATNQYGIASYLLGDPNNTSNYFLTCIGNATARFTARSNGGLANFSANDVNLSDADVKTALRRYTDAELDAFFGALERVDWGVWKYADQTHDDWNHGPTAQGVRDAFKGIADELVDEWNPKNGDGLLAIYSHDLTQIAIASLVHQTQRIRGELASLKSLMQKK